MKKNLATKTIPVVDKADAAGACGCSAEKRKRLIVKSAVTLGSAVLISASVLVAGLHDGCGCGKEARADKFKGKFDEKIAGYIKENPKVLIDSVEAYYKAQQGADAGAGAAAPAPTPKVASPDLIKKIVSDKTNYPLGKSDAKFVIIEFFDYNCGWCKRTSKAIDEALQTKEGANIRWYLIDTPIFGEASELISRYVLAAGKQGKFAEMHRAAINATSKLDEAGLIQLAGGLKLNIDKLKTDANSQAIKDKLEGNKAYARELNINGVPMLIVDGKINPGALFGDKLDEAVKASQAKK